VSQVCVPIFQKQRLAAEIPSCVEDRLQILIEITSKNNDKTAATRNKPSDNFVSFKYSAGIDEQLPENVVNIDASKSVGGNTDFDFTEELTFLLRTLKW
jgi:flagellar basal body L-ring protein FlgH